MPKLISIHSYRGGTGKSNLTANIALSVAKKGFRVAIADTDIQSPGIHNIFCLEPEDIKLTLNDYLWGRNKIEEVSYNLTQKLQLTADQGQLYLIPASVDPDEIARILSEGYNVSLLNDGFRQLVKELNLDYFFVDTHPGLSKETFMSIAMSNILLLILRPDKQDFQGTAVTVDIARQLKVRKMLLMINKVLPSVDFEDLKQQVEKNYETPVVGLFPLSEEMVQLASYGLFINQFPDHSITQEIMKIADVITQ